jgi:hypothetical protein
MAPPMPQFPALDAWQNMDESQQDALIERIAAAQRRRVLAGRLLVGLVCVLVSVGLGFAFYMLA